MMTLQAVRLRAVFALALLVPALASASEQSCIAPAAFRHTVELRTGNSREDSRPRRSRSSAGHILGLQPAGYTPYDRYLGTVRRVIMNSDVRPRSLADACKLLRVAHSFQYARRDPYRADPPSLTSSRKAGDCKSKALWLYDRLGDTSALYVIGRVRSSSRIAHAWVYWHWDERWWILDPTHLSAPIAADSVSANRYVPYYSFNRRGAFRHPATHLVQFSEGARVSAVAELKHR